MIELEQPEAKPENNGGGIGFEPLRQLDGFILRRLADVVCPATTPTVIANENPLRQALYVVQTVGFTEYILSPVPLAPIAFSPAATDRLPKVIHAAIYPLLCQGMWWASCTNAATYAVWELTQN